MKRRPPRTKRTDTLVPDTTLCRTSEFQIGPAAIPDMLRENNVHVPHRVTQLMRKDSLELDEADREAIRDAVAASDAPRILVTHGTDTMVVTGRVLAGIAGKTIVLPGAMQIGRAHV